MYPKFLIEQLTLFPDGVVVEAVPARRDVVRQGHGLRPASRANSFRSPNGKRYVVPRRPCSRAEPSLRGTIQPDSNTEAVHKECLFTVFLLVFIRFKN
jgi:hypothetical protein